MGNEVTVGVLQAILRLKDELTPAIQGMGSKLGEVGNTIGAFATRAGQVLAMKEAQEAIGNVANGIGNIIKEGSHIADLSQRMGVTAEQFQKLSTAAQLGGAPMEAISTAMKALSTQLADGKLPKVLTDMGIKFEDIKKANPGDTFLAALRAIEKIPDPMNQSAAAVALFGRSGQTLLPAIRDGFAQVAQQAPAMSNATVKALDDIGDKWQLLQTRINTARAEALTPVFELFLKLPQPIQTATSLMIEMSGTLSNIGIAILAAGGPKAAFAALMTVIGPIVTFFTATLIPAFVALLPYLGVAGLIAVGVFAIYEAWKHWDAIVAFFKGAFAYVIDTIKKMPDWLAGLLGPIGLVIIAFNHWDQIKNIAMGVYNAVKEWLVDKFKAIIDKVGGAIEWVVSKFAWMQDKVTGHSYVPDMIKGIQSEFAKLQSVMVTPTENATKTVDGLFKNLKDNALKGLKDLGNGFKEMFSPTGILNGLMTSGISFLMGKASELLNRGLTAIGHGIQSLFGTDEEAREVNPARDQFFQGFQNQFGGSQQEALATALMNSGVSGDMADRLIQQIYKADTMKEFEAATKAVDEALHKGTQTAATDAAQLTATTAQSTAAINALINALQTLTSTIASLASSLGAAITPSSPIPETAVTFGGEVPGLATGTGGQFVDWGRGTPVVLHGKERVMTEGEGSGLALNISVGDIHVGSGDSTEVRRATALGVIDALEKGGPAWNKMRILVTQMVAS